MDDNVLLPSDNNCNNCVSTKKKKICSQSSFINNTTGSSDCNNELREEVTVEEDGSEVIVVTNGDVEMTVQQENHETEEKEGQNSNQNGILVNDEGRDSSVLSLVSQINEVFSNEMMESIEVTDAELTSSCNCDPNEVICENGANENHLSTVSEQLNRFDNDLNSNSFVSESDSVVVNRSSSGSSEISDTKDLQAVTESLGAEEEDKIEPQEEKAGAEDGKAEAEAEAEKAEVEQEKTKVGAEEVEVEKAKAEAGNAEAEADSDLVSEVCQSETEITNCDHVTNCKIAEILSSESKSNDVLLSAGVQLGVCDCFTDTNSEPVLSSPPLPDKCSANARVEIGSREEPIYDVPRSLKPDVDDNDDLISGDVVVSEVLEEDTYDVPPTDDLVLLEHAPCSNAFEKDVTLTLDVEKDDTENVYEEIHKEKGIECPSIELRNGKSSEESLFKRCSLVDEVMDEVERVQQKHDQVLQELNLDIENLIMPNTPSVSPMTTGNEVTSQLVVPPIVPPHAQANCARDTTSSRRLSTRTLPPLPTESAANEQQGYPRKSSIGKDSDRSRSTFDSTSVYSSSSQPSSITPTSGVKHWLSRLPSLSSFREKKSRSSERLSWRLSLGHMEEPIYMLYDDTYRLHAGNKYNSDDGIYEDIDKHNCSSNTMPSNVGVYTPFTKTPTGDRRSIDSAEFNDDHSDTESVRSSGSLSVASFKGKILNFGRKLSRQNEEKMKDSKQKPAENESKPEGKLSRLFSKRKGYDLGKLRDKSIIPENTETDGQIPQMRVSSHHLPTILPPPPPGLSPEQTKRRYIVATLVHSENSYIASLRRLVQNYKIPLEESAPPILNANKVATLFHRVPEVLQIHVHFGISLGICVRNWDKEEKIGDVFINTFSKTSVLDAYSGYINNFSSAMELAKQEAKRKSAFTDFLKVKQITSHDRLSFFGLMVKPVQRFPQFILLLQDLLRHTPPGHHDRLSLQLALTQMEMLAEMLNENKRESDQAHAVKEILRHVSAKSTARSLSEGTRFLLRQDSLTQLIFNQNGQWTKSKDRCLFLLNDLLVCVNVATSTTDGRTKTERYSLKWAVPLSEVEVQEDASPILNRMVYAMATGQSSATKGSSDEIEGVQTLYQDLNDLIHDFEVISRISSLVATLRRHHVDLSMDVMHHVSQLVQKAIQQKDEEVKWIDSICLQLTVPLKTKTGKVQRELIIFQTKSMDTKQEWLTDARLAQLALDANNSTAWDFPEQERRPSTKVPLFVKAISVFAAHDPTEVKCGCYHRTVSSRLPLRPQNYVWLCSTDGFNCHISIHTLRQMGLREVFSFDMTECRISAMESVPGVDSPTATLSLYGDTVWVGTESRRVIVYCGSGADNLQEVGSANMTAPVLHIKHHLEQVYVALANGTLAVFKRSNCGQWLLKNFQTVTLGSDPVTCLLPVNSFMYCGCARQVWVLDSPTAKIVHIHSVNHDHLGNIYTMAHSGIGLWLNLRNTPLVCLYHAETFQHLQDINVTSSVKRIISEEYRPGAPRNIYVTVLSASWGLLWVGTNVGVVLSIPLPRLQGMPMLGRRANMAYHANVGPVSMVLVLQNSPSPLTNVKTVKTDPATGKTSDSDTNQNQIYAQPEKPRESYFRAESLSNLAVAKTLPRGWKPASRNIDESDYDVYGLYGNLLNVKDCDDSVTPLEDDLRRSDPELIPSLVSTLDRRMRLNSGRPRSLDLANLIGLNDPVCVSSSSEDGSSATHSLAEIPECIRALPERVVEEPDQTVKATEEPQFKASETVEAPTNSSKGKKPVKGPPQVVQRSLFTLVGGRGYVDLRRPTAVSKDRVPLPMTPNDAHVILWEMKV